MSVHKARATGVLDITYSLCYSEINLKHSEESFHMMEEML